MDRGAASRSRTDVGVEPVAVAFAFDAWSRSQSQSLARLPLIITFHAVARERGGAERAFSEGTPTIAPA